MSRAPMKISGLVRDGKVTPAAGIGPSSNFDLPVPADGQNSIQPGSEVLVPPSQLDDSPFQGRLKMDPARVDEIGASMVAFGQQDPITARVKPDGRLEVVKGHTRKYGAVAHDIPQVRVLIVAMSDTEAEVACLVDNEAATYHEWEYANVYQRVMQAGYAKTQKAAGTMFARSQSHVSKCLMMLNLPGEIRNMLNSQPDLFGAKAAAEILDLWEKQAAYHDIILTAIRKLMDGMEQGQIKQWVLQQISIAQHKSRPRNDPPMRHVINMPSGKPGYITMVKKRDLTIQVADDSLDIEQVRQKIEELLRDLSQKDG